MKDKKVQGGKSAIVFFDFKSAYDTLDWDILFNRILNKGFPREIVKTI